MQNALKELRTNSTCPNCCVGFPLEKGDQFCGFCGQKTQALRVLIEPNFPIYIDQQGPVKIKFKLTNIGLTDCPFNTEILNIQCK